MKIKIISTRSGTDFQGKTFVDYEFNNGFTARWGYTGLHVNGVKNGVIARHSKNYNLVADAILYYIPGA